MRKIIFFLTYKQHGGSGLNWSPSDVADLDLGELQWYVDELGEQRRRESSALNRAARKR